MPSEADTHLTDDEVEALLVTGLHEGWPSFKASLPGSLPLGDWPGEKIFVNGILYVREKEMSDKDRAIALVKAVQEIATSCNISVRQAVWFHGVATGHGNRAMPD